jgi:phosphate transport system substrate-binding protein
MERRWIFLGIAAVIVLLASAGDYGAAYASEETAVRVSGAELAAKQIQDWIVSLAPSRPGLWAVVRQNSAGAGIRALLEGNADIAVLTRPLSAEEAQQASAKGLKLAKKLVAYVPLLVVTNVRNPVKEVTLGQLRDIFVGKITSWKELGGPDELIKCVTRRVPESGATMFFQQLVLAKQQFGSATVMTDTWVSVVSECADAKKLAIGFAAARQVRNPNIKVLPIKTEAKPQTVRDETYPLIVPVYLCWNSTTKDSRIPQIVDYCAIKGVGYK